MFLASLSSIEEVTVRFTMTRSTLAAAAACALVPALPAQWVTFQNETVSRLSAAAGLVATDTQEKDYAWADFDQDGDTDLIIARKSPFTSGGHFPNVLLMNENGVLTDRTSTLGNASTVPGSSGMLDATNDRDVVCADVNGDGWVDIVTCTTLTAGNPQYIRVPRVYLNQGNSVGGTWLGFLYDDPLRINDMQPGASWNGEHRFCSVAAGDIDGDGDLDLYFGDYQQGGTRSIDINDRLLINNGLGYFTDESATRMTAVMLESSFGMKVAMVDVNNDGDLDILKDDALNAPQAVSVSYNDPSNPGNFNSYQIAYPNLAPYHFNMGDLNNDNLPDMIVSDDGQDRYTLNQGQSGGQALWGTPVAFAYVGGGGDDGFGGNNLIADLDNDGWNDAIVADVDVDIAGCSRRCHIFRNLGNAPNVTLQEELIAGAVCGIPTANLVGTFDVAVFDINGDGWKDMVIGKCTGTQVWMNVPPTGMSFTYPGGQPGLVAPGSIRTVDVQASGIGGITPVAGTGKMFTSINGAPFVMTPMSDVSAGLYRVTMPAMPACAGNLRYYVTVDGSNALTYTNPPLGAAGAATITSAVGTVLAYENSMEGPTIGWTVVNGPTLTAGAWSVAIPNGTLDLGQQAAPFEDGEAPVQNTRCFVTQNGNPGGPAGAADVDGGPTHLISPAIDLSGSDGFISYRRWHYSGSAADVMTVAVSGDGVNWTTVETVVPSAGITNVWTTASFRVSDFIVPSATTQVRFSTADVGTGHVVESGVDKFLAESLACTMCQEVIPQGGPGTATYTICGGDLSFGTSATFSVLGMPPGAGVFWTASFVNQQVAWPTAGPGAGTIVDAGFPLAFFFGVADPAGNMVIPGFPPSGIGIPLPLYSQVIYIDAAQAQGFGFTPVVKILLKP